MENEIDTKILTDEEIERIKKIAPESEIYIARRLITHQRMLLSQLESCRSLIKIEEKKFDDSMIVLSDNYLYSFINALLFGFIEGPNLINQKVKRYDRILKFIDDEMVQLKACMDGNQLHIDKLLKDAELG